MAALRFAPPLTKVLAAIHNARRKRPLPTAFLAFVLLCSGSSMAKFSGREFQSAGLVHVIRSGVISQPPGVLRGKCACSYLPLRSARRRSGRHTARSSIVRWWQKCPLQSARRRLLTEPLGRKRRRKHPKRRRANRRLLAGRSRARRRCRALAPDGAAPRTRGRPACPNRAEVDGSSSRVSRPQSWGQQWPNGQESGHSKRHLYPAKYSVCTAASAKRWPQEFPLRSVGCQVISEPA